MKIKTKILLALLLCSFLILSMFSYIAFKYDQKRYVDVTKQQLIAVANIQTHRLTQYLEAKKNMLKMVASHYQLKDSLKNYIETKDEKFKKTIELIILEDKNVLPEIKEIKVTNLSGKVLIATHSELVDKFVPNFPSSVEQLQTIKVGVAVKEKNGELLLRSRVPLFFEEKLVGTIYVNSSLDQLNNITADYTGLGKTGETEVARRVQDEAIFLTPLRFDKNATKIKVSLLDTNRPVVKSIHGDIKFFEDVIDYRGKHVFAATNHEKELGWGVIVKIDKDEVYENLESGRNELYLMLSLIIPLLLLIALYISKSLSDPIIYLTSVVKSFSNGNFNKKADESNNNEIGLLSKAFNKMTEDLLSSTTRLTEAQKITRMGSWEYDIEVDMLIWSDEVYEIFGVNKKEFEPTYNNVMNLVHKDDRNEVNRSFLKSIQNNEKHNIIHRIITPKGEVRFLEESAVHKVNEEGNAIRTFGAVRDITDLKIKEKKLNNQIEITNENIIISSTDIHGNIVSASKAFCEISGYTIEELLGKNHRIVRHPDMKEELYKNLWNTLKKEQTWHGEIKNRKKHGEYYWVEATISPIYDLSDKLIGYTAIRKDITKEKEIEEAQRLANMGNWTLDIKTKKVTFSKQMYSIYEIEEGNYINRDILLSFIEAKDIDRVISSIESALENREEQFHLEFDIKTKKDNKKSIFSQAEIEFDSKNRPLKILGVSLDISERKKIERKFLNAKIEAEQASIAKGEFVANMSHEIRTPMNAILGFTDLALKSKDLPIESRKHLLKSKSSANGLLSIINGILDFSKIESQKLTLENICFNLKNLLHEIIEILEVNAVKKGIDLFLRLESISDCYKGDPYRLKQILINIIGNAIKFTQEGSVILEVSLKRKVVVFKIIDTGIGMSKEQVLTVFEPFVQADTSTVRKFGGTGLGTVISKQLVNLMEGDISVTSQLKEGSTFTITLPLEQAPCTKDCLYHNIQLEEVIETKRLFKILLAEDNLLNAELVQLNLGDQIGHEITWVKNGKEAFNEYRENINKYDLILMDIHMPEMDGIVATEHIRILEQQIDQHIPIIALTASVTKEEQTITFESGMDGFALKPIDLPDLINEMETLVPPDKGKNNLKVLKIQKQEISKLEALKDVINVKKGISFWRDENRYIEALYSFKKNHSDNINKLKELISNKDWDEALRLTHTLKGLSLGFDNLHDISEIIYEQIKNKSENIDIEILERTMDEIISAIDKIKVEKKEDISVNLDNAQLLVNIKELITMLDSGECNEDKFADIKANLKNQISNNKIESLNNTIENFDYEHAIVLLNKILISIKKDIK